MVTRQEAQAALATAVAERDTIQANLLDLDGSFGKQLLSGASLTGETKQRWETTSATLSRLWETYTAYSAVIDQAAQLLNTVRDRDLGSVTGLLTGRTVRLTRGPAPLARRDLADTGVDELTVLATVSQMRRDFATIAEVVSAAEAVWGEVGGMLDAATTRLTQATALAQGLADETLTAALADAAAELSAQRGTLNSDPLSLWRGGHADTSGAARARDQVAAVAAKAEELARLRDGAQARIDALAASASAVQAARQEAEDARQQAAEKIAEAFLPAGPPAEGGFDRAALDELAAAGQWQRLSTEIDQAERHLAAALAACRGAAAAAADTLARRAELRGMLQAYKAKAARLGAAEDLGLTERYDVARDLLWTAPCDLGAAADAVAAYQRAILAIGRG